MGLFDRIVGMVEGVSGMSPEQMAGPLMQELQAHGINGVGDLVGQFEQSGLGAQAASWVGNGENLPIDPQTVQTVLGLPVVAGLAAKFGVDPAQVSQILAQHLPAVVNHLTPDGQTPDASN